MLSQSVLFLMCIRFHLVYTTSIHTRRLPPKAKLRFTPSLECRCHRSFIRRTKMAEKPTPPWADEIPEGSFISYDPTYKVGEYFDRFHKNSFTTAEKGRMSYYFFDPTEHGFPKDKPYPLFIFLHGTSNAGSISDGRTSLSSPAIWRDNARPPPH